jgi:ferric-dicitrate binding protein FerR (iron transport regulator)
MRASVHSQWTRLNAARTRRRRFAIVSATLALAAMLLLVVQFSTGRGVRPPPRRPVVATLSSANGAVIVESQPFANDVPTPSAGGTVRATRIVRTNRGVFAVLTLVGGTSVHVDESTRLRLLSARDIELFDGRLYIDATRAVGEAPALQVRTAFGDVHATSARFEARAKATEIRVRVRHGEVSVRVGEERAPVTSGREVVVGPAGWSRQGAVPFAPDWSWLEKPHPSSTPRPEF